MHEETRPHDIEPIYSTGRAVAVLLCAAGMAMQWAALHSITFIGTVFVQVSEELSTMFWTLNTAVTFAVFLLAFLGSKRVSTLADRRRLPFVLGCLVASGQLAFLIGAYGPFENGFGHVLMYLGEVLISCGTTPLILAWGDMYRNLDPKGEQLFVTLSGIVASIALYLVIILLPQALSYVFFIALPLGSLACLWGAAKKFRNLGDTWTPSSEHVTGKSPALFMACIVIFSIPYNYLQGTSEVQAVTGGGDWPSIVAVVFVALTVDVLAEALAERRGLLLVPTLVLFLLSAAMLVNLFPGSVGASATSVLLYTGYYLFLAMIYLSLGPAAASGRFNNVRLFSLAMMANVGGLLIGSAMTRLTGVLGESAATFTVLTVTYAILFFGFAMLSSSSYSIFRVNHYVRDEYSFEYTVPVVPVGFTSDRRTRDMAVASAEEGKTAIVEAISDHCKVAADIYGLSAREAQVLVELVRGRTIATIANELVVSENTVKAHTKSIYRKLGVHTREELLGAVEGLEGTGKLG